MAKTPRQIISQMAERRRLAKIAKTPSPLDKLPANQGLEADCQAEGEAILEHMAPREKQAAHMGMMTDSDYYVCVCFASAEQKEAFLAAAKWREDWEEKIMGHAYIDGVEIAKKMGIELPAPGKLMTPKGARGKLATVPTLT